MSEDWLDTEGDDTPEGWIDRHRLTDEVAPQASTEEPQLPSTALVPVEPIAQAAAFRTAWASLAERQRLFLNAWRECSFNERKTCRVLAGTTQSVAQRTVQNWKGDPAFKLCLELLRTAAATEYLNRERLIVRHEEAVESLMTPKAVLHQGFATGHFEVEAGAAARVNETLMKVAGLLKDKDIEVNVGVVVGQPTLNIQVMPAPPSKAVQQESVVIDAKFTEVPGDEWLDT